MILYLKLQLRKAVLFSFLLLVIVPASSQTAFLEPFLSLIHNRKQESESWYRYQAAASALRADQLSWRPHLSLSGDLPGLTRQIEPILQDDGTQLFVPRSQSYGGAYMVLKQPIPWTGGELQFVSGLYRSQNFAPWENVSWQSLPIMMRFQQPLFRQAPMVWQSQFNQASVNFAQASLNHQQKISLLEIVSDWMSLTTSNLHYQNSQEAYGRMDSILYIVNKQWKAGRCAYSDVLETQLRVAEAQQLMTEAKGEFLQSREFFFQRWELSHIPTAEIPTSPPDPGIFSSAEFERILHLHPDLKRLELERMVLRKEVRKWQEASRPSVHISGSLGLNQSGNSLKNSYDQPLTSQYLSLAFQYPILDWGERESREEAALAETSAVMAAKKERRNLLVAEFESSIDRLIHLCNNWPSILESRKYAQKAYDWNWHEFQAGRSGIESLFRARENCEYWEGKSLISLLDMWHRWLEIAVYFPESTWMGPTSAE